jgi:hypothetical protein
MKEAKKIKTKYINYPCVIGKWVYRNGQIAINLTREKTGELAATATASLEGIVDIDWNSKEWEGITAIKDYSENEGVLNALIDLGVVEPIGKYVTTEYVSFPLVRVL